MVRHGGGLYGSGCRIESGPESTHEAKVDDVLYSISVENSPQTHSMSTNYIVTSHVSVNHDLMGTNQP